jgi:hypothetical protein
LNQCNLLYVMWQIEPVSRLAVSIKTNPGQDTHEECDARGYVTIKPTTSIQPRELGIGRWHMLRADLRGALLILTADGVSAWQGMLSHKLDGIDGPTGFRTDNARFEFTLSARAGRPRPDAKCQPGKD